MRRRMADCAGDWRGIVSRVPRRGAIRRPAIELSAWGRVARDEQAANGRSFDGSRRACRADLSRPGSAGRPALASGRQARRWGGLPRHLRVESPAQLENYSAEAASNDWLIQPYVHGAPLSLCALFWRGDAALLTVNRQSMALSDEGAFRLTGCEVNAITDDVGQYSMLTRQIAAAVPELEGYAGVDFIQTASGPVVLEINPRLTSSYSALGRALPCNPAALILNLYETGRLPSVDAKAGRRVLVDW